MSAIAAAVFVTAFVTGQQSVPRDLSEMADTERAFAKTATVKGWRDAFLEYFADDALAIGLKATSAKEGLLKQPSTPFSEFELVWEPRLGDVAASGDLGWLTGPSTAINHAVKDARPRHGCYLSVWRKQPNGEWRVFIDVGANAPEPVTFAPGFTRMPFGKRYAGASDKKAASASLAQVDQDLNAQIASQGAKVAFASRTTAATRLHRPGFAPLVGPDANITWQGEQATTSSATHTTAEAGASGDFGYSFGRFEIKARAALAGGYVRLWNRDADGNWLLMVDVAQPARN
jgi:ketosteroid isomerase-like protein